MKYEIKMSRSLALRLLHKGDCVIRYNINNIPIMRLITGKNDYPFSYFVQMFGTFEIKHKDNWWKIAED